MLLYRITACSSFTAQTEIGPDLPGKEEVGRKHVQIPCGQCELETGHEDLPPGFQFTLATWDLNMFPSNF